MNKFFNKKISLAFIFLIILIPLIFLYSESLGGYQEFLSNDKISSMNVKEAVNQSEKYPYWFPWMMGGLPSVHSFQNISDYYLPNYILKMFQSLGMPWFWNFVIHLLFSGIGIYALLRKLGLDKMSSIISGMIFSIMPHITAMLVYGHGSQIMTIAYMPWVFYGYLRLRDNMNLKNLGLFSIIIGLQILRGHPQIAYYTWLMLALCLIIDLGHALYNKQKILKSFLFTVSGLLLGVLSSLSIYIPSLSYLPYSTRSSGSEGGMGFEKATEYSFSPEEIITFFIPSYYGFGNDSYWGMMTMTNFPNYMGIIVILFAIYGLIRYRWTRFKLFISICAFLFLILSFGGSFYKFFYSNLFYFSKFRNPMYMLIVFQFCIVVFAGMGIKMIIEDLINRKIILPIYLGACIFLFSILGISFKGVLKDSVSSLDISEHRRQQYINNVLDSTSEQADRFVIEQSGYIDKKTQLVQSMISNDIEVMAIIIFCCFAGIIVIYFIASNFKSSSYLMYTLSALIALSILLDIYIVNRKIMYPENLDYLSNDTAEKYKSFYNYNGDLSNLKLLKEPKQYPSSGLIEQIMQYKENNPPFRIYDPKRAKDNEWARYHVENILGYHPAHLSSYDIIFSAPEFFFSMMNVKYLIKQNNNIQEFPGLDRVFFIQNLIIDSDDSIEGRIKSYGMGSSANFMSYITDYPSKIDVDWVKGPLGSIVENDYIYNFDLREGNRVVGVDTDNPNEILINIETTGPQFLGISEIYYPNGWYATINNQVCQIFEINDLIRGVFIDKSGKHTIRMWYEPSDLKWGSSISWASIILILIFILSNKIKFFYAIFKK